jgi:hypothetical protein
MLGTKSFHSAIAVGYGRNGCGLIAAVIGQALELLTLMHTRGWAAWAYLAPSHFTSPSQ